VTLAPPEDAKAYHLRQFLELVERYNPGTENRP
jgi:hypothetical protein